MSQSGQTFLFFVKSPNLKDILSFTADVAFCNQKCNMSLFHCRILKCRELLFSDPDVAATPSNSSTSEITGVIPKKKFYSAKFQQMLSRMKLKISQIRDASSAHLQECLQYTVAAKLAPNWNCVQNLLVQGRDFLTSSGFLRAVKLDIYVSDSEITLTVIPRCIKLPSFDTESYLRMYEYSGKSIPMEEQYHVLPSLKVGRVTSLSRTLLSTSKFSNYADIRKHWKNMYGYRLPEVPEEDVWYMNVTFNVPFSPSYCYPVFCVKPYGMTEVPRIDPQLTLNAFINDFCKKVNNICSERCQLLDFKASFPTAMLYPAQDVVEVLIDMHPKLGTTYTMTQSKPYRSCTVNKFDNEKYKNKQQTEGNIGKPSLASSVLKENKQNDLTVRVPEKFKIKTNESPCHSMSYSDKSMNPERKITSYAENHSQRQLGFKAPQTNNTINDNNQVFSNPHVLSISSERNCVESEVLPGISIDNLPQQMSFDESNNSQTKYAPKFYPKTSKPVKVLKVTDYFTETKSKKQAPDFPVHRKGSACLLQPSYKNSAPASTSNLNHSDFEENVTPKMSSIITFQSRKSKASSVKVIEDKSSSTKRRKTNVSSGVGTNQKINTAHQTSARKKTKV